MVVLTMRTRRASIIQEDFDKAVGFFKTAAYAFDF